MEKAERYAKATLNATRAGTGEAFNTTRAACGKVITSVQGLKWEELKHAPKEHVKAHPLLTAFQVSCLFATWVPGLVASAALTGLGFGGLGPTAAFQSTFGTPLGFSMLQSAAMGGWGVGIVNGAVQGGAVTAAIVSEAAKRRVGRK